MSGTKSISLVALISSKTARTLPVASASSTSANRLIGGGFLGRVGRSARGTGTRSPRHTMTICDVRLYPLVSIKRQYPTVISVQITKEGIRPVETSYFVLFEV